MKKGSGELIWCVYMTKKRPWVQFSPELCINSSYIITNNNNSYFKLLLLLKEMFGFEDHKEIEIEIDLDSCIC